LMSPEATFPALAVPASPEQASTSAAAARPKYCQYDFMAQPPQDSEKR
jgi:hypothetical protein